MYHFTFHSFGNLDWELYFLSPAHIIATFGKQTTISRKINSEPFVLPFMSIFQIGKFFFTSFKK